MRKGTQSMRAELRRIGCVQFAVMPDGPPVALSVVDPPTDSNGLDEEMLRAACGIGWCEPSDAEADGGGDA